MDTLYWHDYETWGINPAEDMPSQFAGVRTDSNFNIVGEPLNILCRPALDVIPHAEACLVTGMTPQQVDEQGVSERDFFAAIHAELAQPNTCSVGYNSLRFDDEVTRYGLYRNFYDPYGREWQNGNTRWDVIDMLRLCYAVRPEGINWPQRDDGVVSFRLEQLTEANGLSHEAAHDALSDVYATIAVAKLIKETHPQLFNHVFSLRQKQKAQEALALGTGKPVLHISSRFGSEFCCGSLVLPIAQHPKNKNEIICVDLRYSPKPLFDLDPQQIADLLFSWKVAKMVKSNAIIYGKDGQTIGVGAGQMSRVNSARIAAIKAEHAGLQVEGSCMASDAFFPFRDGIDNAAKVGISCVIQPGGSMRDEEVIAAADEHNMAMVFTGMRHFRH